MKEQLNLTPEQKTMFLTLCGKALDYRSKNSVLNDKKANEIVATSGLELEKYSDSKNRIIAVRAKQFDEWMADFINKNPDAVVVNIGCGLDTRISRINLPSTINWFDIDFPDVIELRRRFYAESENYKMLSSSVTTDDWLKKVPNNKPTLIVAEGLMSYLSEEEVKVLLNRLTDYFPKGEIIFNVISKLARQKGIKTIGAIQKFIVEDIEELDKLNPKMKREETLSLFESKYLQKMPFIYRSLLRMAASSKKYKNMIRLVRYEF